MPTELGTLTIELRSVNHRYLDCNFKMPDTLRSLEGSFREQTAKALARGKVDGMLRLQSQGAGTSGPLTLDDQRLQEVVKAAHTIAAQLDNPQPLNPLEVLHFPGVCIASESAEQALQDAARTLFASALDSLRANRAREGEKMAQVVLDRLALVEQEVTRTRNQLPALLQHQRDKVIQRISELDFDADQGRLEQELVYMAQKADVDEELDRLAAHIGEVRHTLKKGGPCGRRLDFLMQEFNREANTLSSKSTASSTTSTAVELKVLIEQMREQIQNIE